MGNDVLRFMHQHKISTACLAGHGIGGLLALKAATRNVERFTGYVGLDCAPVNYNNFEVFHDIKASFKNISDINLNKPRASILNDINSGVNVGPFHSGHEVETYFSTGLGEE
jgi:pimeloyl-ACP methyl ester carboxylesterase